MTDYETCSWCTTEVPDSTLRETSDGARICRDCWGEMQEASEVYIGLGTGFRYTGRAAR